MQSRNSERIACYRCCLRLAAAIDVVVSVANEMLRCVIRGLVDDSGLASKIPIVAVSRDKNAELVILGSLTNGSSNRNRSCMRLLSL